MKRENISDALGLLDDSMIEHAVMVREDRRKKENMEAKHGSCNMLRQLKYGVAACLGLALVSAAAFLLIAGSRSQYEPENDLQQEENISDEQLIQDNPEPEIPERFVEVSSLLASNDGNFAEQQVETYAFVPIEKYMGIYTEVPSADGSVLSESIGKCIDIGKEWYCISGHSDLQYLIRNDKTGFSLWKFQCFDSSEYPYNDVLELVYHINSADGITKVEVTPAAMDNTDEGKQIQEEIGTCIITDRNKIEKMYKILSGMTCYGSDRWDRIDYGNAEAEGVAGAESHEAVRLGRYLSITTDYGNVIDGLKYTAVSDMFYEFSGIAYNPLTEEQAAEVCEIIGIVK